MNRLFHIVKPILLYLVISIIIAGSSFVRVGAEDGLTTLSPETTSSPVIVTEPEPTYTYNEATGLWDSNTWYYDPVLGSYQPVLPPVEITNAPEIESAQGQSDGLPAPVLEETVNNTVDVNNAIDSGTTTGDASVLTNTDAGSAASGNADAAATILNNVNSVTDLGGSNSSIATFSADVVGDVSGDIVLQPIISQAIANPITATDTVEKLTNLNSITNNINLSANSGDALVENNTKAGDATTGSADTIANVINIVNSMVVAGQSFIGAINIYGNFIGNILISPDFVPRLLASNSGLETSPKAVIVNASDTIDIINNLSLSAISGQALLAGNTQAGNAITGDALTNIVIFNMTGHSIIASNCLLVFINVLGEWYGVIVDAPVGATAAIIGGNVESDTVSMPNLNATIDNKVEIENNITLKSQSGDASVLDNTVAGNAKSGNATASVNLANIVGSRFSLSGWFGLLFINVFGKWFGDFGVEAKPTTPVINNVENSTVEPVIKFVSKESSVADFKPSNVLASTDSDIATQMPIAQTVSEPESKGAVLAAIDKKVSSSIDYILILIITMVVLIISSMSWLGIQRFRIMRRA